MNGGNCGGGGNAAAVEIWEYAIKLGRRNEQRRMLCYNNERGATGILNTTNTGEYRLQRALVPKQSVKAAAINKLRYYDDQIKTRTSIMTVVIIM